MTERRCDNCEFYSPENLEDYALHGCYRYPPKQQAVPVRSDSWCGEFQPKESDEPEAPEEEERLYFRKGEE